VADSGGAIEILKAEFELRKKKKPGYSLRAFAMHLGLSHTVVSLVLTGKRPLSQKAALQIVDRLKLSAEKSRVILNSEFRRRGRAPMVYDELNLESFNIISDWAYYAVLSLFEIPSTKFDPNWIATRLNIPEARAEHVLQGLVANGLLAKTQGVWKQTGKPIKIENPVSTKVTRSFNKKLIGKAIESLEYDPIELRNLSSTTFAVDTAQLPFAIKRIREFRRKLTAELEKKGTPKEVYSLTVQLFPLTKGL
jgi:uncharacterized protein (TIGR02147 family)